MRIWCYVCEVEVFKDANDPPFFTEDRKSVESSQSDGSPTRGSPVYSVQEESESDEDEDTLVKPRGLTGLQNLGNTCYMNGALQALSNCPPLSRFFIDCPGYVRPDKKPMLSRSYLRLVSEMWHKKRPSYIVPSSVFHGIRIVHPMFRGYTQQDTQEFLRCFMDQLHEELKTPIDSCDLEKCNESENVAPVNFEEKSVVPNTSNNARRLSIENSNPSDTEYETCDSGVNSERNSVENSNGSEDGIETSTQPQSKSTSNDAVVNVTTNDNQNGSNLSSKALKENANIASKVANNPQATSNTDSTEFTDAETDVESLQNSNNKDSKPKAGVSPAKKAPEDNVSSAAHLKNAAVNNTSSLSTSSPTQFVKKRQAIQYRSVISDIFDGQILSSVQCLTCERISSKKETFQDLSLPIPTKDHLDMIHASHGTKGSCGEVNLHQGWLALMLGWLKSWFWGPIINLQDCLSAFFSADELKGDNMYSCDKCKKLRNGVKYSKVLELPEILCIHLKRFRHEVMFSSKINNRVTFPLDDLDMGPYLHKDCSSEVSLFDLIGVICHHGTAGGGHYTSYCLNYINEQWYEFDDQYVTEVDAQQVENCEAYVLFYRKKNDHMTMLRQRAMETMDAKESSLMKFYVSKQWINRFNTFAEPGPITNSDFLCRHGGVPPNKMLCIEELVTCLSQQMWEFLHDRFGGGPAVNHLYQCTTCLLDLEKLRNRQQHELEVFIKLNNDFQNEENPSIIYAISMSWFKEWEVFVRGHEEEPPGSIDNSKIAAMKGGSHVVKLSSDYGQLSQAMWQFLFEIYGGGPLLVLKQNDVVPSSSHSSVSSKQVPPPDEPVVSASGETRELANEETPQINEAGDNSTLPQV